MNHEHWMREALIEAQKAFDANEVPIGSIIVKDNRIIGRGYNKTESLNDPTAHAEIIAISAASNYLNSWRLTNATVYVTLEPCLMCTGALILARIERLVFGAYDKKFGACGSLYNIPQDNLFNHSFEVIPNILSQESKALLKEFFRKQRLIKKTHKPHLKTHGGYLIR
ncbi:MAG: tRNA adenosine(34) deaminase TadA [candidate division WOR-3 bacterium]